LTDCFSYYSMHSTCFNKLLYKCLCVVRQINSHALYCSYSPPPIQGRFKQQLSPSLVHFGASEGQSLQRGTGHLKKFCQPYVQICSFWHKTNISSLNFQPRCPVILNKIFIGGQWRQTSESSSSSSSSNSLIKKVVKRNFTNGEENGVQIIVNNNVYTKLLLRNGETVPPGPS